MKRTIIVLAILALAGCATTEVMDYQAAPGAEVLTGKGGAFKKVNGIDVYFNDGSPPRAFRIIADAKTRYRTGTAGDIGQRQSALEQLAAEAIKRGADAVIVYGEQSRNAGFVAMPGASTTTVTGYGNTARAQTYNAPAYGGSLGAHEIGALFVKYEKE